MLARLGDLLKLRACDIEECLLNGSPALQIRFRTSKTDPSFKGNLSYLVKVDNPLCSYTILRNYFLAYGFRFGSSEITDSSYLFCRSQTVGSGVARCIFLLIFIIFII